ncbi:hypothetical protein AAEO56_07865 [Flavobacterium sp. DGU11]|uniref:Uncharacterized protein n=1 Tax=Flavobacterium arundinis TaxID=3139143 RepID=A0ABU9HVI3_9FLAO
MHLTREGLQSVIGFEGGLDDISKENQDEDIAQIKAFVEKHGYDNLYEVATF